MLSFLQTTFRRFFKGAAFRLFLDHVPSAAIPVWIVALKNNTSLKNLELRMTTFDIANVHDFRTALRLNTVLTSASFVIV